MNFLTTKNVNRKGNSLVLDDYSDDILKKIERKWCYKKSALLKIDLWTGDENLNHGDIVAVNILESHMGSGYGNGYVHIYYSDDRMHYLQRKMIYANTKGLYIEFNGRTYLDLPDIALDDEDIPGELETFIDKLVEYIYKENTNVKDGPESFSEEGMKKAIEILKGINLDEVDDLDHLRFLFAKEIDDSLVTEKTYGDLFFNTGMLLVESKFEGKVNEIDPSVRRSIGN